MGYLRAAQLVPVLPRVHCDVFLTLSTWTSCVHHPETRFILLFHASTMMAMRIFGDCMCVFFFLFCPVWCSLCWFMLLFQAVSVVAFVTLAQCMMHDFTAHTQLYSSKYAAQGLKLQCLVPNPATGCGHMPSQPGLPRVLQRVALLRP